MNTPPRPPAPGRRPAAAVALTLLAAPLLAAPAPAGPPSLLDGFKPYRQGAPVALLADTRQALFRGTHQPAVRAAREHDLLAFLASDAHPQAKAIAVEWLGCLGSEAALPALQRLLADPALAQPAAAAVARITGQAAQPPAPAGPPASAVAAVVAFTTALDADPAGPAADRLLLDSLRSPDRLVHGAALRAIRRGAGTGALAGHLIPHLAALPAATRAGLLEALAARPGPADDLHAFLLEQSENASPADQPAALRTLGRILRPADVPPLLALAAGADAPLAAAARDALARATDPAIDRGLLDAAAGPDAARALAAIDVLAARHSAAAVDPLWALARAGDPARAPAALRALGDLLPPARLPELLEWLPSIAASPLAEPGDKALWAALRRHPEPAAAAAAVDAAAAAAPPALRETLARFAARIRPAATPPPPPPPPPLDLPADDDRATLAPNGFRELACLDCGAATEASANGLTIRRAAGSPYTFGNTPHPLATVDFGAETTHVLTGLDPAADHVLGLSVWDADLGGRRQTLALDGEPVLRSFIPLAFHGDRPTFARIHLPVSAAAAADGTLTVTMRADAGPNAVVSQLWLLRREPAPGPAAVRRRVMILTGDDYAGHRWRETGPAFAAILRGDPQLEVSISESPYLLESPALASCDAVFLHFKNYPERLPTAAPLWQNLERYVRGGGGLVIAHFACGALQEWPGFAACAGRAWDPRMRPHDPHGEFTVRISNNSHPATRGLADFTTRDELYTCLAGNAPVTVLAEATSSVDQSVHPIALALTPGKGRVFHCLLGHDTAALASPGARALYLQGTLWAAGAPAE